MHRAPSSAVRARRILLVAALALPALAGPVRAAEPSVADRASAKDFLREGKDLRDAGDHLGARKKFEAAYALVPTPITGYLLAREQVATGQLLEAREVLDAIDRMPVKSTETVDGRQARADAASLLSEVLPKIPVIEVRLKGLGAGASASVQVDGELVPLVAAQQGVRVNPGKHVVTAKVDALERTQTIEAKEGQRAIAELDVTVVVAPPAKPAEPPKPPQPTVTPPRPEPVKAAPAPAAPIADAGGGATKWIGIAGLGVGVVTMGVSGLMGLSAKSTYNDATSQHCPTGPCDPQGLQGISDARSRAGAATIVLGVGAAIAVGGAVLWLTAPSGGEAKTGVTSVGVGAGGLVVGGRF